MLQDSDGEAGIALVGVHSDFPKYGAGPVDEKCPNSNGGATVGYDSDDNDDGDPSITQISTQCVWGVKINLMLSVFCLFVRFIVKLELKLHCSQPSSCL